MARMISLGECMVELRLAGRAPAVIGYAGDTFNTAVYARRLGLEAGYATALGRGDPFSEGILAVMAEERVAAELVIQVEGRLPGVYAISLDDSGERSFYYWRSDAPVRDFFRLVDAARLEEAMRQADVVYLSGVTLAVIGEAGCAALMPLLAQAAAAGTAVAFDPNYRAQLWDRPEAARAAVEAVVPHCRYLSFSALDAAALYGRSAAETARTWAAAGAEVVAREEDHTVKVYQGKDVRSFPPEPPIPAIDTTGAGDAFNAAYLTGRLTGEEPDAAVPEARRLARIVVQHPGAIIPALAMPTAGKA
jgi:2-dehydro-3-deoxygluconokinase